MPTYVRVKDKATGHEFDVLKQDKRIGPAFELVKKDEYPESPAPRRPKHKTTVSEAVEKKGAKNG